MATRELEFKGKPILEMTITDQDKFPCALGVQKAKKVLANIEALKAFVEKYGGAA